MADWQKGDLALCINDDSCFVRGAASPYRKGRLYTVTSIKSGTDNFGRPATGIKTDHCSECWWNVVFFIKVTPPSDMLAEPLTTAQPEEVG